MAKLIICIRYSSIWQSCQYIEEAFEKIILFKTYESNMTRPITREVMTNQEGSFPYISFLLIFFSGKDFMA